MEDKLITLMLEMKQSLGGVHAKLDSYKELFEDHVNSDKTLHAELDDRTTSLEGTRTKATGSWAVLGVAIAVVSCLATLLATAWAQK
jgi:hypothetical protein